MNPQALASVGVMVLLLVTHGYAWVSGARHRALEYEAAKVAEIERARETERMWQGVVNETDKNWKARASGIQRNLDIALDSLRDRSVRLPEEARANCSGTTGRELSAEDGRFLAREAARADKHRSALEACYEYADKVK